MQRPQVWLALRDRQADAASPWQPVLRFEFDEVLRADAASGTARLAAEGLALHLLSGDQPGSVAAPARTRTRVAGVTVAPAFPSVTQCAAVTTVRGCPA